MPTKKDLIELIKSEESLLYEGVTSTKKNLDLLELRMFKIGNNYEQFDITEEEIGKKIAPYIYLQVMETIEKSTTNKFSNKKPFEIAHSMAVSFISGVYNSDTDANEIEIQEKAVDAWLDYHLETTGKVLDPIENAQKLATESLKSQHYFTRLQAQKYKDSIPFFIDSVTKPKILFIDDNETYYSTNEMFLTEKYFVQRVKSTKKTRGALKGDNGYIGIKHYDLIILAYDFGGKEGEASISLLDIIRANPINNQIPIIIVSKPEYDLNAHIDVGKFKEDDVIYRSAPTSKLIEKVDSYIPAENK